MSAMPSMLPLPAPPQAARATVEDDTTGVADEAAGEAADEALDDGSRGAAPGAAAVVPDLGRGLGVGGGVGVGVGGGVGRGVAVGVAGRVPVVLLAGMLGDETVWDAVAAGLDGLLPWPVRIDLDDSVPELAASVLAAAPDRFLLAGHSLGGIVALEIVRQQPHRVAGLALVAASARGPVAAQHEAWAAWRRRTVAGEFAAVAAELARVTLGPAARTDPELVEANERMASRVGPAGFLRQLAAQGTRPDSRDSLAFLDMPVKVLSGEQDEICPPELQAEIAELCSKAELITLPGGHMLPLECPDEVAECLRDLAAALRSNRRSAP